ncbi:MAG: xanthine dehydrogenase family protein molybdopterin-binding subunit, partial [Pseudomonadales bacterium]|nr:xanthine dehydrogenase family protein molybdopterin-binding subunit [Pseudomonadales bacterium]
MGKLATITRRTLLVGSAAVAGGVVFGVYKAKAPIKNPLLDSLQPGEAAITPYVKIDASGITLITPRADKGQGSYSLQAHLLAEELDVDPHGVNLSPGMPDPAYYNAKVMSEGLPFAATDDSKLARSARDMGGTMAKMMGMQMTGGSSTVPDSYEKLRHAGAVARETLKQAAAQRSGISRSELNTKNGRVLFPDGNSIAYTELAAAAAQLDPVRDVALRDQSEWRLLGKNMLRTDIVAKSTGTEIYGIDLVMQNMLYASVRSNPGLGGKRLNYDAGRARAMRGVKKIVETRHGIGVIADNTWRAFRAVNAIDVDWGKPDYPASSKETWDVLANSFVDEHRNSRLKDLGDVEQAQKDSKVIEAEYRVPYLAHAPLEPMNAVVLVGDERLDIWTGTQIPGFIQDHAAKLTGINNDNVFVHVQPMGGSFGHRLEFSYAMQAIEVAMGVKGTPVKMTWTREEDMAQDFPRPAQIARGKGTVQAGQLESVDLAIACDSISVSWFGRLMGMGVPGPDLLIVAGAWDQPFDIPNYRVSGYRAPVNRPISSWRSVGASGNGFFHASFLDELMHAAGADPLQELIRLCNHDVSRKVLQAVGDLCNWQGTQIGKNRGRGIAYTLSFGVPVAEVIDVTNTPSGIRIDKVYVALDVGKIIDPVNFEAQVSGGALFGLAHAMNCELTYENYQPQQTNF